MNDLVFVLVCTQVHDEGVIDDFGFIRDLVFSAEEIADRSPSLRHPNEDSISEKYVQETHLWSKLCE